MAGGEDHAAPQAERLFEVLEALIADPCPHVSFVDERKLRHCDDNTRDIAEAPIEIRLLF
jgi:hypothetical protein